MNPKVEVRADDSWPRIPKYNHLEPVVVDIATGVVHAAPQAGMVCYLRPVCRLAGRVAGLVFFFMNSCQLDAVVMAVGATTVHRERVFVGPRQDY